MKKHRVAIVGLGMAVTPHAKSFIDLEGRVEVACAFAPSEARRNAFAEKFPFPLADSLDEVLRDGSIDAVLLLTPPSTHLDLVRACAAAGKHVLSVWNEVIPAMTKGALIIDCSTIDVESAKQAHALAAKHGALSVDAPVSGGTGGAKGATLTFMCCGEDKAFAAARPVLENMGKKLVHCGGGGAGQAAKICNNMILGISMIGVGEAFALAEKLGLSHQALFDVASTSSGQCWSLTSYCPVPELVPASPANRDYRPGFAAALMLKDLKLSQEAAQAAGAATPLGAGPRV